jgi:hypothetical protein
VAVAVLAPVAAAAAAALAVVVADGAVRKKGGLKVMSRGSILHRLERLNLVLLFAAATLVWAQAPATKQPSAPKQPDATKQAPATKTYATPEEARDAFVQAAAAGMDALKALLGPGADDAIRTGDPVQDKVALDRFKSRAKEKAQLVPAEENPDRITLEVGNEEWPMAIPLLKKSGRWHWDLREGKIEIRNRVIGGNELDGIAICVGFVEAQQKYAEVDRTGKGIPTYASKLVSTPGQKDGLYWQGEDSPISAEGFAKAAAQGYTAASKGQGYHGYRFKLLTGQGASAYGGARDYLVSGLMIGGFGLVAWPVEYEVSGIKTFIVNQDGVVYEKDLGPQTSTIAPAMTRFNPDKTWDESPDPE